MQLDFISPKEAFESAIQNSILSAVEADPTFAGNFMYMGTKEGVHQFKNIVTRKYGHDRDSILEAVKN